MLKLRKGSQVPYPEKLSEGYEVNENRIIANISADKIADVMNHFIRVHNEPLFFILELPTSVYDETEIEPGVLEAMHIDVYYIDGCSAQAALSIMNRAGNLLINDGLCAFGFGGHFSKDEIVFGKYNVTTIYSKEIEKFQDFLEEHYISHVEKLVTAWDTFDHEHPGSSERVITDGKDVYSIPDTFSDLGIYMAERREA